MTRTEIQEFKRFLHVRELFGMFSQYYRQNHLTSNPPTLEAYLEKAKAETAIPLAFVYPKTIYGKDFWLAVHEEWNQHLSEIRADCNEAEQLNSLDLEIIDIRPKTSCLGLPKNATDPKPTDYRCGADVQPSERHRGEVQAGLEQSAV